MTLALSILALLLGCASLAYWAHRLEDREAELDERERALESARAARQQQLVELALAEARLAQRGVMVFPMPRARA